METTHTTLGQLPCSIIRTGIELPDVVVVLCHGYGAPPDDLVALGEVIASSIPQASQRACFVFPEAPLMVHGGGGAWWNLDIEQLMLRQRGGPDGIALLRQQIPEGIVPARRLLRGAIDMLLRDLRLPYSQLVLGGFSQGAMLATDLALRLEEAPGALAILSGSFIDEAGWRSRAPMRRGLRVLQSHGTSDPILPFAMAEALRAMLVEAGLVVDFVPFSGGHTIVQEALSRLGGLIARVQRPT